MLVLIDIRLVVEFVVLYHTASQPLPLRIGRTGCGSEIELTWRRLQIFFSPWRSNGNLKPQEPRVSGGGVPPSR